MYYVYVIECKLNDKYYIGYTNSYSDRWNSHKYYVKTGNTKLYNYMRKYGIDNFEMVLLNSFKAKQEAIDFEISNIDLEDDNCLNLAPGGEGGYVIQDKNKKAWIKKLKEKRKGGKPALGMKHSEENKRLFSEVSKEYWKTKTTYNPEEILKHDFKKANKLFGISKTHYYRLLKRAKTNDLS